MYIYHVGLEKYHNALLPRRVCMQILLHPSAARVIQARHQRTEADSANKVEISERHIPHTFQSMKLPHRFSAYASYPHHRGQRLRPSRSG